MNVADSHIVILVYYIQIWLLFISQKQESEKQDFQILLWENRFVNYISQSSNDSA